MIHDETEGHEMISALDKEFISPLLRKRGFTTQGLTWNRRRSEIVDMIEVQISKFSDEDRVDLTVNVGICMPQVWTVYSSRKLPRFIKEEDCWPSFRIGELAANFSPKATDLWWTLTSDEDVERVGCELNNVITTRCLPFLDGLQCLEDVKRFYDRKSLRLMPGGKLYCAILNYLVGDLVTYKRLISEFENEKLSAWRPHVSRVIERLSEGKKEEMSGTA